MLPLMPADKYLQCFPGLPGQLISRVASNIGEKVFYGGLRLLEAFTGFLLQRFGMEQFYRAISIFYDLLFLQTCQRFCDRCALDA